MTDDEIDLFIDAVAAAEARGLADHQGGACRESEWTCSHCEATGRFDDEADALFIDAARAATRDIPPAATP